MTTCPNVLHISQLQCDDFERAVLPMARHLVLSLTQPEHHCWHRAFVIAVEQWDESVGLSVAYHLQKLVRALLHCRTEGLTFQDPLCIDDKHTVTRDEWLLIGMIHNMRRDQTPEARDCVYQITRGRMDPVVIRTALQFATRFSCGVGGAIRQTAAAPVLRVVQ
ncbi:hypothetical protein AB9K34_07410 [Sedimentitalea sp. XS_ASV28]|uniref:hypothetical protein n=1 Tax=Sedimentitalea sp. XS_ASV28 TaxID=3241296 RepID=UPI0035195120